MYKIFLLSAFLLLTYASAFTADTTLLYKKKNSLFIEVGGKGPYYSLNYGKIFKEGRNFTYSWRAGFSILSHDLSLPIAITAFTKGLQHHLELSFGLTPYLKDYKTFLHKNDLSDKQFYITPGIGYRYQKAANNFFISAGFDPNIFIDPPSDNIFNFTPMFKPTAHFTLGVLF